MNRFGPDPNVDSEIALDPGPEFGQIDTNQAGKLFLIEEFAMSAVRGIRGAINVVENSQEAIFSASRLLIESILENNKIKPEDIAGVLFTATVDLDADFPAYAARDMGLELVPLLCAQEIAVPGAMERVVRVLVYVNSDLSQSEINHQYLGDTARLRPDLVSGEEK